MRCLFRHNYISSSPYIYWFQNAFDQVNPKKLILAILLAYLETEEIFFSSRIVSELIKKLISFFSTKVVVIQGLINSLILLLRYPLMIL